MSLANKGDSPTADAQGSSRAFPPSGEAFYHAGMKKEPRDEMNDDLRSEYDLSRLLSHSVQGKYAERFRAESIVTPSDDEHTEPPPADVFEGEDPDR